MAGACECNREGGKACRSRPVQHCPPGRFHSGGRPAGFGCSCLRADDHDFRVGMAYGYEVKAPSSHFLMNIVGDVEFISVTAGDQPAFYIGNRLIEGGLPGVSSELDRISREHGENGSRMGIALRLDDSVSRALEQQLVDMVLAKGMTCYIAAEPAD